MIPEILGIIIIGLIIFFIFWKITKMIIKAVIIAVVLIVILVSSIIVIAYVNPNEDCICKKILPGFLKKPSKTSSEPVCGDGTCSESEKQGCIQDCGGVAGITKMQCEQAGGFWNECGSPCAGTDAEFCILSCSVQCECGGIAGYRCPEGFACRLSNVVVDEMGVCIEDPELH